MAIRPSDWHESMPVPYDAKKNLGEVSYQPATHDAVVDRHLDRDEKHDEQYSPSPEHWWGVAAHSRPSTETGPDA